MVDGSRPVVQDGRAPVDDEVLADGECRLVRGEEDDGFRDLDGRAEAPRGDAGGDVLHRAVVVLGGDAQLVVQRGRDRAGADGIDAEAGVEFSAAAGLKKQLND